MKPIKKLPQASTSSNPTDDDIYQLVLIDDEIEIDSDDESFRYLPTRVVSTMWDSLFLDGNSTKMLAQDIESQHRTEQFLATGYLYQARISKPYWADRGRYSAIQAYVYNSTVNTADRHVLDSIITVGRLLPREVVKNSTLRQVIEYWQRIENRDCESKPNVIYSHEYSSMQTKMDFDKSPFNDKYFYYIVNVKMLCDMIGIQPNHNNRKTLLQRLTRIADSRFEVEFLDDRNNVINTGPRPMFKLVESNFYTFTNLVGIRNRTNLSEWSFTNILVGIGEGYFKSLKMDSSFSRSKFIHTFAGVQDKANVVDFLKWCTPHKPSYVKNNKVKKLLKQYYVQKARPTSDEETDRQVKQPGRPISSKVNSTLNALVQEEYRMSIQQCLNMGLVIERSEKGKVVDARFVSLDERDLITVMK